LAAATDQTPRVLFGGPDLPPRALRNELQARIEAVPAGGKIAWSTYYFRDRALAQALMAASDRGVQVMLRIEGEPRFPEVNREVIAMLEEHGLKGRLKVHRPPQRRFEKRYPYWHSKIYCFSHPEPVALVGSFNPSGDVPEDPEIITNIGDQDRGHNLLVEFRGRRAFGALRARVRRMGRWWPKYDPMQNLPIRLGSSTIWNYPRRSPGIIDEQLGRLGQGDRVVGAVSHLKHGELADNLGAAAQRGASIDLLLHDTERRVPEAIVSELTDAGVSARRYVHPDDLPLHLKFLLVEEKGQRCAWFGSFNFNRRSYRHNQELLVTSSDPAIIEALEQRFATVEAEVEAQRPG
jgi:hypothetical protein